MTSSQSADEERPAVAQAHKIQQTMRRPAASARDEATQVTIHEAVEATVISRKLSADEKRSERDEATSYRKIYQQRATVQPADDSADALCVDNQSQDTSRKIPVASYSGSSRKLHCYYISSRQRFQQKMNSVV
ncbi:hypothetical protein F511_43681 [Dorcoceras hygrometricum]|uniref:Uncharacterized protein n=1 Tax=Dorcoceras hygrometricum TaxID=472368 RepID=A0A2Z7C0W6_9LAMI|nr:hypothetical protein F511_43681 [Dorcoceras hygrometricum]